MSELKGNICCKGCYKLGIQKGKQEALEEVKDKLQDLFINGKLRKCYQEITLDELKKELADEN